MGRKKEHAHADERWLLTYADMITLLMALFMVLFSIAVVNKGKFDELAKSLRESFSGPLSSGGNAVLNVGAKNPTASARSEVQTPDRPLRPEEAVKAAQQRQDAALTRQRASTYAGYQDQALLAAQQAINAKAAALGFKDQVQTQISSQGLIIRLVTDKVLFDVGSFTLRREASPLLTAVAQAIEQVQSNPIRVNGHTDAIPFAGDPNGNERLAVDRALAVFLFMEGHGFSVKRHPDSAPAGFGSRDPLVPNESTTGAGPRNRRVEVIVQRINYTARANAAITGAIGGNPVGVPAIGAGITKIAP